jgi:hypothetical protein
VIRKIYSKVESDKLMHMVCVPREVKGKRIDVVPASEFIQLSILNMEKEKTFPPHKHIYKEVPDKR